ncbi:MAG: acyltransferase family protein [Cyanobacteria bacterium SBC]|nr:acyltransferase family protein [Cyanobacteria bacterium SBC]
MDKALISRERDIKLDILKVIGLAGIILAHANPNEFINGIRNFDVPLMVLVSGTLFAKSSNLKTRSTGAYLKKRLLRLIAPTWVFFGFFFICIGIICLITGARYPYPNDEIIETFFLLGGIGYTWIVRVFIIIAAISPLLVNFLFKAKDRKTRYFWTIAIYVLYESIVLSIGDLDEEDFVFAGIDDRFDRLMFWIYDIGVQKTLFYAIPYSCLFAFGAMLDRLSQKTIAYLSIANFTIFTTIAAWLYFKNGEFIRTQDYKYPPQLYYLSYAIFVSLLLYFVVDRILKSFPQEAIRSNPITQLFVFVSSSSLWIYLWHIFFVHYDDEILESLLGVPAWVSLKFMLVFSLSLLTTYAQKRLVRHLTSNTAFGQKNANWLSLVFLK